MSDIPQLERALVDAARRRTRTWRPPRWVIGGLVAATAAVLAALVVRAAGPDLERAAEPPPPPPPVEVTGLLARVGETIGNDPSCEWVGTDRRGRVVAGVASAAAREAFGVLRRPAERGFGYPRGWLKSPPAGAEILAGSVRPLREPGGSPYLLAVSRGPYAVHRRDPEACRARWQAEFDRIAPRLRAEDARYARYFIEDITRDGSGMGPRQEHLELFRFNTDGTVNGVWTLPLEDAVAEGIYVTLVKGRGPMARTIAGIVPDGVAAVSIRSHDRAGDASTTRAQVRENMVYATLPRGDEPEVTITWLDAAGRELRRVAYMAA
jgi:hypothetical protein